MCFGDSQLTNLLLNRFNSLGGALATLFALWAATTECPNIPKPVKCVAVASLFVGGADYQESFKKAEDMGLVQLLRISGYCDIINTLPFISFNLNLNLNGLLSRLFQCRASF